MKRPLRILLGSLVVVLLAVAYAIYWRGIGVRFERHDTAKVEEEVVELLKQSATAKARQLLSPLEPNQKMETLLQLLHKGDCAVKVFAVHELARFQDDARVKDALEDASKGSDDCASAVRALLERGKGAQP
jgi:hypothetical protein